MLGRTLSHYEVKQELSRGGMGVVYRALDTKLDREVALKVLPPELVADEARRRRFVQEAKAAAAIHHPHIATIHEIGGEPVRITEDAHLDFGPVWTPDGKSLLLSPTVAAAETAIESPSTLHAGPPASPSVSRPDSTSLRSGNRDIFAISSDGGTARQLTNDPAQERYPHWPPDGTKIVFQSTRGDSLGIYVVSRDRGELAGETPKRVALGTKAMVP